MAPKRQKKKKGAIPLIKTATASSLAKKKQETTLSRTSRRRKRSRELGSNHNSNNNKQLFSSTKESLDIISKFHTLNKRLEQNANDTTISETERQRIAQQIQKEQEALGGLDRYQKASIYGAKSSKFVCADWVIPLLKKQKGKQLRILDVGAIDHQYEKYESWLDAVPIDLHGGQHEQVLPVDFFEYAHEYCRGKDMYASHGQKNKKNEFSASSTTSSTTKPFDAIVLSLVLNFQGDPRKRGDMLCLAADSRLLADEGMLFVALPSASLENSRYCDLDRFIEVATNPLFGLELIEQKISAKLVLLAFQKKAQKIQQSCCYNATKKTFDYGDHEMKRLPAKPGTKRNNFAVILKSSHNRT